MLLPGMLAPNHRANHGHVVQGPAETAGAPLHQSLCLPAAWRGWKRPEGKQLAADLELLVLRTEGFLGPGYCQTLEILYPCTPHRVT